MKKNLQINTLDNPMKRAIANNSMRNGSNSEDPHLVCNQRELSENIEEEIKAGFFELRQKFCDNYPSSIYISHIILHQKHPVFMKCEIETLKRLLTESSVVYL